MDSPEKKTPMAPKGLTFKEISLGKVKVLRIIGDQVTWEGISIKGLDMYSTYHICMHSNRYIYT